MKHRLIFIFLACEMIVAFLTLSGCLFSFASEYHEQIGNKIYLIDSSTLLESIKNEGKNVFIILPEIPTTSPEKDISLTTWKLEDYLLITEKFFNNVLGESLDNWKLSQIDANRECKYFDKGYSFVNFTFFKEINQKDSYRSIHIINIVPSGNYIYDTEEKYTQLVDNWKSINYRNMKISPESAILIAEKAGGEVYRAKYLNECRINITFRTDEENSNSWHLIYRMLDDKNLKTFEIYVNAIDGKYRLVQ